LLRTLGWDFVVVPSEAKELSHPQLTARELCLVNARRKALAVAKRFPEDLVLGADTLVSLGTTLFGKPADRAEAARMLARLARRSHLVVTGVCLMHFGGRHERRFAVATMVAFRPLTSGQIRAYLTAINPLDKAGAYAIQEHGEAIIAGISGSYSNVVGLPLERLRAELAAWPGGAGLVRSGGRAVGRW
jgi:septum formation protein